MPESWLTTTATMPHDADAFILGLALNGRPGLPQAGGSQLQASWSAGLRCAALPADRVAWCCGSASAASSSNRWVAAEACATSETLLSIHGAMSGGWVKICGGEVTRLVRGPHRPAPARSLSFSLTAADLALALPTWPTIQVRLFAIDEWPGSAGGAPTISVPPLPPTRGVLYLSSVLRRNLGLPRLHPPGALASVWLRVQSTPPPGFASEAVIARVASPHPSAAAASCRRQLTGNFAPGVCSGHQPASQPAIARLLCYRSVTIASLSLSLCLSLCVHGGAGVGRVIDRRAVCRRHLRRASAERADAGQ
jgi:hypothetical protein